jgi:hypothetical protein
MFVCGRCATEFDHHLSFADYDLYETKKILVGCPECKCENTQMLVICKDALCLDIGPLSSDPKTLGALAERNAKYRIPQAEEEADKKREERIKAGKPVKPKEVKTWWEKPEKPITQEVLKERKLKKDEFLRKSAAHNKSGNRNKNKPT